MGYGVVGGGGVGSVLQHRPQTTPTHNPISHVPTSGFRLKFGSLWSLFNPGGIQLNQFELNQTILLHHKIIPANTVGIKYISYVFTKYIKCATFQGSISINETETGCTTAVFITWESQLRSERPG